MSAPARWYSRANVDRFVHSSRVQNAIVIVILINAATLGFETSKTVMANVGDALHLLDKICLAIFIVEIALKLYAQGWRFFTSAWNVFDFLVVGVALVPGADGFAVLRALRVLRVLRLVSVVPALRRVVDALVRALPGIASIAALLAIIFYVGAVMSTMLFGARFPDEFGNLGNSLFSLFQIMTLDNWSQLARMVAAEIPWAPAFFVPFVLISALTVLNLFIAVIVDAMQGLDASEDRAKAARTDSASDTPAQPEHDHRVVLGQHHDAETARELADVRRQLALLTAAISAAGVNLSVPDTTDRVDVSRPQG